jgi:hypothetical protein
VPACLQRGCSPADIRAAVAYFQTRGDLGPGSLYEKLSRMGPGEVASRRFPPPPPLSTEPAERGRRIAAERKQVDAEEAERDRDDEHFRRLNQDHGPELDALTDDELTKLDEHLPTALRKAGKLAPDSVRRFERLKLLERKAVTA